MLRDMGGMLACATHARLRACMHADSKLLTGVRSTGLGCHRKSAVHSSRRTSVGRYVAVAAARTVRILIRAVETRAAIQVARGVGLVREGDASQLQSRQGCVQDVAW
jgi:hypothetical protein